jgi:hypothetical protein
MTARERLELVEEGWYEVTKGELWLAPDVDGTEGDVDLAKLALAMWDEVESFTSTVDVDQTDLENFGDRGIAMRIAEALAILHFGGRWVS